MKKKMQGDKSRFTNDYGGASQRGPTAGDIPGNYSERRRVDADTGSRNDGSVSIDDDGFDEHQSIDDSLED